MRKVTGRSGTQWQNYFGSDLEVQFTCLCSEQIERLLAGYHWSREQQKLMLLSNWNKLLVWGPEPWVASLGHGLGGVLRTGEREEVSGSEVPALPLGPQTLLLGHTEHNCIEIFFNAQNLIRTNFSFLFCLLFCQELWHHRDKWSFIQPESL